MNIESFKFFADLYDAFNAREIDKVLAQFAPDVDWPASTEGDGRVIGHEAIRGYWTRQWAQISPTVRPTHVTSLDDGVYEVTVHQHVEDLAGKVLMDAELKHIYTLENGLVKRMDIAA